MPKLEYNDDSVEDSEIGASAKVIRMVDLEQSPVTLYPGYSVHILSEMIDGMCEVSAPNGRRGYIPRDALGDVRRLYG